MPSDDYEIEDSPNGLGSTIEGVEIVEEVAQITKQFHTMWQLISHYDACGTRCVASVT